MMRLAYRWASVAAAVAAATGGPALPFLADPALAAPPQAQLTQPSEQELTTWGVRPADTGHGTGRSNFEYAVEPGATITDEFLVSNYNEVPLELDVYAVDAYTSRQGELAAALATEAPDGAGGWIGLESTHLVVPEGESVRVEFTLTVPEDAEPGDHSAAILTSLLAQDASGLSVDRRLGSRVHIRVAGEAAPALSIVDMSIETGHPANPFTDRPVRVSYTVVNTGNIRISGDVDVSVRDLLGRDLGGGAPPERLTVPEILPGDRVDLVTELTGVGAPLLRLTVEVAIEPRPAPGPSPLPATEPVTETRGVWVLPWLLLGAGAVLALGLIGWRYRRRHAQQRFEARVAEAAAAHRLGRDQKVSSMLE